MRRFIFNVQNWRTMNYHKILYLLFPVLAVFCLAGLASCDYIHDELPLCRHTLRFVYRHNIKHADAFAYEMMNQEREKNVRLYIYDQDGKFLGGAERPRLYLDGTRRRLYDRRLPHGTESTQKQSGQRAVGTLPG